MLRKKLEQALQDLVNRPDVKRATIAAHPKRVQNNNDEAQLVVIRSLGEGAELSVWHSAAPRPDFEAAVEGCVRTIRTLWRLTSEDLTDLSLPKSVVDPKTQTLARMTRFVEALVGSCQARSGFLMYHGEVLTGAGDDEPVWREQLDLLSRQLDKASVNSKQSSHVSIAREDVYALSFYFGAALFLFFEGPYALSFTEHRSRSVARELSQLISMYDDRPPPTTAQQNPVPES